MLSVVAEREPSISDGLVASTVTPGRTAPEPSCTTPTIALCARTDEDPASARMAAMNRERSAVIYGLLGRRSLGPVALASQDARVGTRGRRIASAAGDSGHSCGGAAT